MDFFKKLMGIIDKNKEEDRQYNEDVDALMPIINSLNKVRIVNESSLPIMLDRVSGKINRPQLLSTDEKKKIARMLAVLANMSVRDLDTSREISGGTLEDIIKNVSISTQEIEDKINSLEQRLLQDLEKDAFGSKQLIKNISKRVNSIAESKAYDIISKTL